MSRRMTRMRTRKHHHGKYCKCKYCARKSKSNTSRHSHKRHTRSRARRGGAQTSIGGNMTYKNGQWYSLNSVGGRS